MPRCEGNSRSENDGPLSTEELGVKDDAEVSIVYGGRYMASTMQTNEAPANSFVIEGTVSWSTYGQVVVRISGSKIITRAPRTPTLGERLRGATGAPNAENRPLYPEKMRRTCQHRHHSGEGPKHVVRVRLRSGCVGSECVWYRFTVPADIAIEFGSSSSSAYIH